MTRSLLSGMRVSPGLSRSRPAASPLAEFLRAVGEFDEVVADLAKMSADHFGADPDAVNWGDVESARDRVARLRSVTDAYFRRGEFAPAAADASADPALPPGVRIRSASGGRVAVEARAGAGGPWVALGTYASLDAALASVAE